ncbi:MAG: YihY/virulence factor BrkB family protein [Phycisphaerales bacterium]
MSLRLQHLVQWVRRAATEPRSELNRWQRAARFGYELTVVGAHQLRHDRAAQMAAALSFRTLFGLLPTLVVATLAVRALGGFADFEDAVARQVRGLGFNEVRATAMDAPAALLAGPPAEFAVPGPDLTGVAQSPMIATESPALEAISAESDSLEAWVLSVVGAVENINLAAITWVGVGVLIYSALSLMTTIESSFNVICRAPEGRPWSLRLPIYFTVLMLGGAIIAGVTYADIRVDAFLAATLGSGGWAIRLAAIVWSGAVTTLLLLSVYKLVPNTTVPTRHALVGAFVAMLAIETIKRSFGVYVEHALSLRQLTGSLGLLPLFMLWVYVQWLVILFGLEVAQVLRRRAGRELEVLRKAESMPSVVDPAAILIVAGAVAGRFEAGKPSAASAVASATGLPEAAVRAMLDRLVTDGILLRVEGPDAPYSFARPPAGVSAADLLAAGQRLFTVGSADTVGGSLALVERLRAAERAAAAGLTAASLGVGGDSGPTKPAVG